MYQIHMGPTNEFARLLELTSLGEDSDWQIEDQTGMTEFHGRLIGAGTSQRERHSHVMTPVSTRISGVERVRCAACRWSESYVFRVTPTTKFDPLMFHPSRTGSPIASRVLLTGGYCVYTLGPSIVRGESTRARIRWCVSGHEVMEACLVRRGDRGEPWLPAAAARMLAMASGVDRIIESAYVNRAVA